MADKTLKSGIVFIVSLAVFGAVFLLLDVLLFGAQGLTFIFRG